MPLGLEQLALAELARLDAAHLLRTPRVIDGAQGPEVFVGGRSAICLCSNNYLGFAGHPVIADAVRDALGRDGFGACASRHVSGSMSLHVELERRAASFVGQERALLFATGFTANLGALQALGSAPRVLILSDALNHASLIDGCRISRAEVVVYRHNDAEHVEALLKEHRERFAAALVVTESIFSMDGDLAPVRALRSICDRYDAALFVDEAHALGAIGPRGRGLCATLGVKPDILTAMFGKAFGVSGAFVAASDAVARLIENRARCYVFSTAPSPTLPAAALAAIDLVADADDRRARLATHAQRLRNGLARQGFRVPAGHGHIIPVLLGAPERAAEFSGALLERGVFVHGIRPPTVPPGTSRLRVVPIATHEARHIDLALEAFGELPGR